MTKKESSQLGNQIIQQNKQQRILEYEQNPSFCLYCKSPLPYKNRHNKFCNSSCAAKYNNSIRTTTTKNKTKPFICKKCGSVVYKSIHTPHQNLVYCDCCKKQINPVPCKICGSLNCINDFCKESNIKKLLNSFSKYFNLDISKLGSLSILEEYNKVKNTLYDLYINQKKSSVEIAKIFNCPIYIVTDALYSLNIKLRNKSEALNLAVVNGNMNLNKSHTIYKDEWHTTWDNREVYLRSSYETDYANELDEKHIWYDVECFRIKYYDTQEQKFRCAIPDFYLRDSNTIVEIKSSYTYDEQNMKDKFKAYQELGYNTKLILNHQYITIN